LSGQQVGSVVGGVIGAYFGGQVGYAIGSAIGGAIGGYVDPTVIKGPKLTDATQQTASDGIPIPWGHGTFPTAGNIIWRSDLLERKKEDDGKGTGIVNVTYHYYRSYAIGICSGVRQSDGTYLPIEGILQAKSNGKIVYDVSPGVSSEQQAQNTKFMRNTRFYLGSETQDPDSVIESHEGVGNAPAYPGMVYMVRENIELTESGGAIEQFEFVVSICGDTVLNPGTDPHLPFTWMVAGPSGSLISSDSASTFGDSITVPALADWNTVLTSGTRLLLMGDNSYYSDDYGINWLPLSNLPGNGTDEFTPSIVTSSGRICVFNKDQNLFCYSTDRGDTWFTTDLGALNVLFIAGDDEAIIVANNTLNRLSTDGGSSFGSDRSNNTSFGIEGTALGYGDGMFVLGGGGAYPDKFGYTTDNGVSGTATSDWPGGLAAQCIQVLYSDGVGWFSAHKQNSDSTGGNILFSTSGTDWVNVTTPSMHFGTTSSQYLAEKDGLVIAAAGDDLANLVVAYRSSSTVFSEATLEGDAVGASTSTVSGVLRDINSNDFAREIPDAPGWYIEDGEVIGPDTETLERCKPTLGEIVLDACLRSGLSADDVDVVQLTDEVDGFKVATETTAEAIIGPLMQGFFFDVAEFDDKIRFIKRGGDVVADLTYDDLCESDGDVIEETELQEAELLQKVNVRTIDPAAGFTVTTQTAERRTSTVLAKGEQTTEIPVVTDKDTQARMADKKLKVGWSETRRFKTNLPYTLPQYTPTDVIGLTDNRGRRQRVRLMEMAEDSGRIEIREAMLDRQSSYTSNVEGVTHDPPTDTAPGLVGPTFGYAGNWPRLRSGDIGPGAYIAACGYLRGWGGCTVLLSVDGGTSYQEVAQFVEPSTMGTLSAACTSNSEPIRVFMNSGTLSSITDAQIALRQNAFAITTNGVSELGQFRDAVIDSSEIYDLTNNVRGGLGTTAAPHIEGNPFVMAASAKLVPLDLSLAGQTLYFKFVSFGTSADDTEAIEFVFSPLFFGAPTIEPYTDDADNIYTDEADNVYYYEAD
jgi:hypothetical protein